MSWNDPSEPVLAAVRAKLSLGSPLQGAALSINAIAAELGVSHTPVREALARLAGEGLVVRTVGGGYVGVVHDAVSLSELYGFAGLLAGWLLKDLRDAAGLPTNSADLLTVLDERAVNRALAAEHRRVRVQLAPFAQGEAMVLGAERPLLAGRLGEGLRRWHLRRVRRSGAILAASLTRPSRP
ncbi:GntR family transcriptional regulator [Caulobacter hibisci]|uniref:GntR family transcriptional regulator n=1 Tax=Caulobacter hibisci TaxID=2035993 RepID=A0ABS0T4J2_9CAUL|nr:GntR family transcriptional regulator [Caulobacter hibisci]MBI1686794.1 GntR family transcriptional regulator [Caulobacter hibisci]